MNRYRCSGRGPGLQAACDFAADDACLAFDHFEAFDHDVEPVAPACRGLPSNACGAPTRSVTSWSVTTGDRP
jgi:hypothetical protein